MSRELNSFAARRTPLAIDNNYIDYIVYIKKSVGGSAKSLPSNPSRQRLSYPSILEHEFDGTAAEQLSRDENKPFSKRAYNTFRSLQ